MKIAIATGDEYAPHASTVIESIIRNSPSKQDFVVVYISLSEETRNKMSSHFDGRVRSLEFACVGDKLNHVKHNHSYISLNTYLKIFLPELLDDSAVLYIDCDVIVRHDITELCNCFEPGKFAIWGVEDIYYSVVDPNFENYRAQIFAKPDMAAFNAGIMIMDLDLWRKEDLTDKVLSIIAKGQIPLTCLDQDVQNHYCQGNWGLLPAKWNVILGLADSVDAPNLYLRYDYGEVASSLQDPALIHFVGRLKPWHYLSTNPYTEDYWKYRKLSAFPISVAEDRTPKKMLIVFTRRIKGAIPQPIKMFVKHILAKR